MENLEQETNPGGEAGATVSQGELDAQETQTVESTGSVSDGQVEEAGQASNPWDSDPKFKGKGPEDIYRAYQESQKLSGQLSQKAQVANLINEKYGLTPEQFMAHIESQEQQAIAKQYAENPLAYEVAQLKQTVAQQQAKEALLNEEKELDKFLSTNPEYQPFRDKILKLGLSSEQDKTYQEIANEWFGESRAQGQQDAYKKIETKKTQTTAAKSTPQKNLTIDDFKSLSLDEMESLLPRR